MEGLLIKFLFLFLIPIVSFADAKIIMVKYMNTPWGHVHQNSSRYSASLTTVSCGHPLKVVELNNKGWTKVIAGPYTGFVQDINLGSKKPECLQDKYPRFFDDLKLEITQMYYWGKLYDQYVEGKSRLK